MRRRRGIARALLLAGALAGMTLGAPANAQIAFRAASQANSSAGQAAPTFQAAGTAVSGTGSVTPVWPAHAVGDVALLLVESAGGEPATLSVAAGFAAVANSPQASGAGTAGTRVTVFWARATSTTMPTPTVADPGNHVYARILTYRGVIATGNPWDVTGGGVKAAASTSVTVTGVTTTTPNTLLVQGVARDGDSAAAAFSAQTNANLTGITEQSDAGTTSGNGGGFAVWDGVMATAGATGNTTATVTSSINAFLTVALRAPDAVLTINVPAGTLANDVMIASITYRPCSSASGAACTTTITPPAGWTQVNTVTDQTIGGGTGGFGNRVFVYRRVATGAEPASYTWTFGGALVHAGAAGGIISFSGVDTASPIVAQAGQTTAAATSHAAPSINTGAVTNTMLVSSHTANSSTLWTQQVGMTERVDVASLPVSNDLGLALEMNHELFAGSGATGTRTSTYFAGPPAPPAADAGATHMLALRPAVVVVPPPGDFNAFETSTAAGAIAGQIFTKLAGSVFGLDIVAILGGVQQAAFTNTVQVDLVTGSTGGLNCPGTPLTIAGTTQSVNLTSGRGTTGAFNVANAYRDVRVRMRYPVVSPTVTSCSTDNFSIRPTVFTVTSTNATQTGSSGTPTIKTGANFNLTAASVAGYDGTPGIDNTKVVGTPTAGAIGGNFGAAPVGTGIATGGSFFYSEVGNFGLNADTVRDTAFTSIDQAPGDCVASSTSNTLAGGKYGCWVGSTAVAQATGVSGFGRFIPDNFNVTYTTPPIFGTVCGTFTYVGTRFTYPTAVMAVTARNGTNNGLTNAPTVNYAGAYRKLSNAAGTSLNQAPYDTQDGRYSRFDALGAGLTPARDTSGVPATTADPLIGVFAGGSGTLTFDSGTGLGFTRSTTTPSAPFNADIALALNVVDTDGVVFAGNPASFGVASAGNGISFSGGKEMRFGRMRLDNAFGSTLLDLPLSLNLEYYNGTSFTINAADTCTTLLGSDMRFTFLGATPNLVACETAIVPAGAIFFVGGKASSTTPALTPIKLAKPGSTNDGAVDIAINLNGVVGNRCTAIGAAGPAATNANKPWLQGNWGTPSYNADPTGRATFGIYKNADQFLYLREVY